MRGRCRRRGGRRLRCGWRRRWLGGGCRGWSRRRFRGGWRCRRCCRRSVGRLLRGRTRRRCRGSGFSGRRLCRGRCAVDGGKHERSRKHGQDRTASSSQHPRISPIWLANLPAGTAPDQPASASRPRIGAGSGNGATVKRQRRRNRSTGALGAVIVATLAHSQAGNPMGARLIGCYRLGMRAATELEGQPRRDRLDVDAAAGVRCEHRSRQAWRSAGDRR